MRKSQERVRTLLPQAGRGAARLQWLLDEMEWIIRFQQAETAAVKARDLLAQKKPREALALLDGDSLAQALQAVARRVTTRGEHGVLATINTKAVFAGNELRQQCLAALNQTEATGANREWNPEPKILWPRLIGSVPAGEALELKPICLGGKAAWLHYRPLGQKDWKSLPLWPVKGWVQRGIIPADAVVEPGLEVGYSFSSDPGAAMSLGPLALTVMPTTMAERQPLPKIALRKNPGLHLAAKSTEKFPVVLSWNEMPEADYFKVYCGGRLVAETAVAFSPDAFQEAAAQRDYLVEAWRDGKVIAKAQKRYALSDLEVTEAAKPNVLPQAGGVTLQWPAFRSLHVTQFKIHVRGGAENKETTAVIPAVRSGSHSYQVALTPGQWSFEIIPINQTGRDGRAAVLRFNWPLAEQRYRLELPLTEKPAEGKVVGDVSFGIDGAILSGGHIELPHDDGMNVRSTFRLTCEFKADRVSEMPVLLSHGCWQADGWYAQILSGQLVVCTPGGDAQGPAIQPGRWYAVVWEVVNHQHRLLVDGKEVMLAKEFRPVPAKRSLMIGQYDAVKPEFAFHGAIRRVVLESLQFELK